MCGKCNQKQSLILPFPSMINTDLVDEYIVKKSTGGLTNEWVFNTFNLIYKTNYDFSNEKAKHRAWQNMEQLVGYYNRNKDELQEKYNLFKTSNDYSEMMKIKVNDIVYEKKGNYWLLVEGEKQKKPNKKGFVGRFTDAEFQEYISKFDTIEFL